VKHTLPFIVAISLLSTGSAIAHHSFFVQFDMAQRITVEGTVTELQLKNPHAEIFLDVTDDQGGIANWRIEMSGKLSLSRRGWTDDTVMQGDRITVVGNPSLTGKPELWWNTLILEDGTQIDDPLLQDSNAIDAERRQRAREGSPDQ